MEIASHTRFHQGQRVRRRDDGSEALIQSVVFGQTKPQPSGAEHVLYLIEDDYYVASQLEEVTFNELLQR